MKRRTVIVEGPVAFAQRRWQAACHSECGVQIYTLALLAARLAGGFHRPALSADLEPCIKQALDAGGFVDIEKMRQLPGMTRSTARTLIDLWSKDVSLRDLSSSNGRLSDLALIERRVLTALPPGVLPPRELRDAAMQRLHHAPAILGEVELDRLSRVPPVWRPLLEALHEVIELRWMGHSAATEPWFPGLLLPDTDAVGASPIEVASCADSSAEVVESLRWARELIASGRARPEEIAICSTSTERWDEYFVTLVDSSALPIHFSNGRPALSTWDGQACAALVDVLLNGLSQDRIRRLLRYSAGRCAALEDLPPNAMKGLHRAAGLFELSQWQRALADAIAKDADRIDPAPVLLPSLELLARGMSAARRAGELLLGGPARSMWFRALSAAPAEALAFTLETLKVPDAMDSCSSIVWSPAAHLLGAPRPYLRLLGLNSNQWPRRDSEDPLLPTHLLIRPFADEESVTHRDRRAFELLISKAFRVCVISFSQRDAQGRPLSPSPLIQGYPVRVHTRGRIPEHAFSESDRLMARPKEAILSHPLVGGLNCWKAWRTEGATAHDGVVRPDHPVIRQAMTRVQSATSLRLLLRDPLAFIWRYALGWHSTVEEEEPLSLDDRVFGELVHELLRRAVRSLEPQPGYANASKIDLRSALDLAVDEVRAQWPLIRAIPPKILWEHTLMEADRLAIKALTFEQTVSANTRCWTEVPFGEPDAAGEWPWNPTDAVIIPGTGIGVRGSIDRLDLRWDGHAVRVSDYKTGCEPAHAEKIVLAGGSEVQRVIYAITARALLPHVPQVAARLVFLGGEEASAHRLADIEEAIATISARLRDAQILLQEGKAVPHIRDRTDDAEFRLALPADIETYIETKRSTFRKHFGELLNFWRSA